MQIPKISRDVAILVVGLAIGAYEVIYGGARPTVLAFVGSLLAGPLVLRADEKRNKDREDSEATK